MKNWLPKAMVPCFCLLFLLGCGDGWLPGFSTSRSAPSSGSTSEPASESQAGWKAPELIESGNGAASCVNIAMDSAGNAIAAWSQSDGTTRNIYANWYDVGTGTWGTEELLEESIYGDVDLTTIDGDPIQVVIDANKRALVVWGQSDGSNNIYATPATHPPLNRWALTGIITMPNAVAAAKKIEYPIAETMMPLAAAISNAPR